MALMNRCLCLKIQKIKERHRKLDAAMDEIRMKFGNDKITRASIMNSNARIGRKAKAQMKKRKDGRTCSKERTEH